jgi:hypothetical protein
MAARKAFADVYRGLAAAEDLQDSAPFSSVAQARTVVLSLDPPQQGRALDLQPQASVSEEAQNKEEVVEAKEVGAIGDTTSEQAPCGFCNETGHDQDSCPEAGAV